MFTSAALCAVIGIILGLRFRVMVLVPMNVIVLATVTGLNISHGRALAAAVIEAVIAIIALDLGCIGAATARLLVLSRRLDASSNQRSATGNDAEDVENRD